MKACGLGMDNSQKQFAGTLIVPLIVRINLLLGGLRMVYQGAGGSGKRRSSRDASS